MKTLWNHTGRAPRFSFRLPPGGGLPHFIILFSLLLLTAPAGLVSSCNGPHEDITYPGEGVTVPIDSSTFTLRFQVQDNISDSARRAERLDVFLYEAEGIRQLDTWRRLDGIPDSLCIRTSARPKTVVAIANCPRAFNRSAIERFDSMELLSLEFDEDSPSAPLLSGTCSADPGKEVLVTLCPLMCRVVLSRISNTMTGYVRLEDPRIWLENMNLDAEVLRESGFRPSEFIQGTRKVSLPYDIGIFTQTPFTELFCYPNDSAELTIGTPATTFVLECEISGSTCRFPVKLPPLKRNSTVYVEMTVHGKGDAEANAYQTR